LNHETESETEKTNRKPEKKKPTETRKQQRRNQLWRKNGGKESIFFFDF
tara:strand:- start:1148 stop:1294 length:147 start_codon:yes stop_codon:yes gene_type:complete